MKRFWLALLLLMACAALRAQEHIVARIVDAKTGSPLPFASVYVNGANSTISNADGEFLVDVAPHDTLRFTYVGYKTLWLKASEVGVTVKMQVDDKTLGEVTVMGTELIVENVMKRLKKEFRKHKKEQCNLFYRQLTYSDNRCCSFLESFFSGLSSVQLRDLSLVTGRYVFAANSMTSNPLNFYTFAQVPIYSTKRWFEYDEQMVPLHSRYNKTFKMKSQAVSDGERIVYRVDFQPIDTTCWSMKGSFYVDDSTFELLKFEGVGQRDIVKHTVKGISWVLPLDYSFVVTYIDDNDFTEVGSVYFQTHFSLNDVEYDTTGIMYNVGERFFKGHDKLGFKNNLLWSIKKQGLDPDFWRDNEIVKRTPIEEEALELFERDNLFGVY